MSRQAAPRAAAARSSPSAAAASRPVTPLQQHEELFPSEESYEAEHEEEERAEEEDELHAAPGGEGQQSRDELEDEAEHAHHYQLAPIHSQSQPQRSPPHRVPKPSSLQVQSESQWHATPSNARRLPSSTLASPDTDLLSGVRTVPSTPPLGAASSAGAGAGGAVASVGAVGVLVRPPKRLLDAGLAAVKTNLKPGLALQCVALLIIIVYFGSDSARAGFDRLAEFKSRAGYAFSAVSTSIFGGLLPWLIIQAKKEVARRQREKAAAMVAGLDLSQAEGAGEGDVALGGGGGGATHIQVNDEPLSNLALDAQLHEESLSTAAAPAAASGAVTSSSVAPAPWAECLFLVCFWALKGMEVDAFYRLQAIIWGSDNKPGTIIGKVFTDQFLYSPPWATPSVLAAYNWKDCNFSFTRWWPLVSCRHFWLWRVPENLVSGWMVWIPAVSMIYILPASLQIPLFNIVLCFWSLVLTLITAV